MCFIVKYYKNKNVWYVVLYLLYEMINWKDIWIIYKFLILEFMMILKFLKVKFFMNWFLRIIVEFMMLVMFGRDLSFFLRDNIWFLLDMLIYMEIKNVYFCWNLFF